MRPFVIGRAIRMHPSVIRCAVRVRLSSAAWGRGARPLPEDVPPGSAAGS